MTVLSFRFIYTDHCHFITVITVISFTLVIVFHLRQSLSLSKPASLIPFCPVFQAPACPIMLSRPKDLPEHQAVHPDVPPAEMGMPDMESDRVLTARHLRGGGRVRCRFLPPGQLGPGGPGRGGTLGGGALRHADTATELVDGGEDGVPLHDGGPSSGDRWDFFW